MEDIEIIDVNDEDEPEVHARSLENQDMSFLRQTAEDFLGQYGWHLLFLTVGVILLIQYLSKRRANKGNNGSSSETVQDPSLIVRRQEALDASRRRMQEELDAKAAEFREKQKTQEEEKRRQKIEIWESMQEGKSYKAKFAEVKEEASSSSTQLKPKTDKNVLRNSGYNPLTGDGGGACSWRPGRRGPSSGG